MSENFAVTQDWEKEKQYYLIDFENIEKFPVVFSQYYLKSRKRINKELSFVGYFCTSLLNQIQEAIQEYLSEEEIVELFETLENTLSRILFEEGNDQDLKQRDDLLAQISLNKNALIEKLQDREVEVNGDERLKIAGLVADVNRFFNEDTFAQHYLNTAVIDKICGVFKSLNIIQQTKLKNKLLEIEGLWEVKNENTENHFKRNFLKFPNRYVYKSLNTISHYVAYDEIFQVLLFSSNHSQIKSFAENYKAFNQSIVQLENFEIKACNAYIELLNLKDKAVVSDNKKFISELLKLENLFQFLSSKSENLSAEFILTIQNKLQEQVESLLEQFCEILTKLEKLHLLTCLKGKDERSMILSKIDNKTSQAQKLDAINTTINVLQEISANLDELYERLNDQDREEKSTYNFNQEQSNYLASKLVSVTENIFELFQKDAINVIKKNILIVIAREYKVNHDDCLFSHKNKDITEEDKALIQELSLIQRQQSVFEQIYEDLEGTNFLPILIKNPYSIGDVENLPRISKTHIRNKILNSIPDDKSPENFVELILEDFVHGISIYQLEKMFFDNSNANLFTNKTLDLIKEEVAKRASFKNVMLSFFKKPLRDEYYYAKKLLPQLKFAPIAEEEESFDFSDFGSDFFAEEGCQVVDQSTAEYARKLIAVIQKKR
jgi:hypothetical protein